ncbi:reticulocyte binding protein 2b [Plasmodium ovale curtisi]|uniref:Reticulocyte binding protein 2b n=1 Tax=Plasmodium ovale curtisi TaxID=864141 RepID=A0A1A8WM79_PLAOA|nr:reticulocyte binding protein 2b [Plasmodium ovale curtisi]
MSDDTSYENDNDVSDGKNSYNELLKNRDNIINKGNSISNDIHSFKEKIKSTEYKLLSHHDTVDILKTHTNKKYSDISTLLQKYEKEKEKFKLSNKDEQDFNTDKKTVTIKSSSVEELKSKKNSLTEKVKTHMREINNDELIGQDIHKMLKNALDKEMSGINNKFPDDSINKLKT